MGRMPFSRSDRLASSVQKDLSEMISTKKLKEFRDPRFQGLISITGVRVTNGYQHLDIFFSVFEENYDGGDFCAGLTVTFELRFAIITVLGDLITERGDSLLFGQPQIKGKERMFS